MVAEVAQTLKEDGHKSSNIYHEDFTLANKPDPLYRSILFEGNIPGLELFHKILIYVGAIVVPIFYALASYNLWLGNTIF